MTSPRYLVSLAALLLMTFAGGCKKADGSEADSTGASSDSTAAPTDAAPTTALALPVAAVPVREGDLVITVSTTGQVASDEVSALRSEVAGTIQKVLVRPGDRVRRGQVLINFDPRNLEINVKDAEAQLDRAMQTFRESYYPDSVVTGRVPTEEQRRTAMIKAGVPTAQVALERAKLDREKATVVSPFDGLVDQVPVAAGMRVGAGELLTRVVNLGALRIDAQVLEHDMPLIREGGQATVTSAAANRVIMGRIVAVLPIVDTTTRSGRAFVRIPAGSSLRPGMYADVKLEAARLTGRRLVPTRAIIQRDNRPLVFVVKNGRAQWVYINPGRSNGLETEVLPDSGTGLIPVEVGDEVIVEGHLTLTHDATVRVVNADTGRTGTPIRRPD
ncbi:MAG TPA: efflux RND transporter periplasmic adaptor subunit [Gemmatimonadaceae bacterium]|nr:efflux RND transporter periplasmic adaptor subunit [Gemmatimonadaceae bacterium]